MSLESLNQFEFISKSNSKNNCILGTGSFGAVKLAQHKDTKQQFAIKIIQLKNTKSTVERDAIDREIRVHKSLNHPNIVNYYSSFQEDNTYYLVMEHVECGNLYQKLQRNKFFSEEQAFNFWHQSVLAIQHMHQNDKMHRDIKPENILLDKNNNVKLCDFGWCAENINLKRQTFCGTYEYMAPEVVMRLHYDFHIDIWSLGILLYELLHGYTPFKAKTFPEITKKIQAHNIVFNERIPEQAKDLISRILRKNPAERLSINQILEHEWVQTMLGHKNQALMMTSTLQSNQNVVNTATKPNLHVETTGPKANQLLKQQQQMQQAMLESYSSSPSQLKERTVFNKLEPKEVQEVAVELKNNSGLLNQQQHQIPKSAMLNRNKENETANANVNSATQIPRTNNRTEKRAATGIFQSVQKGAEFLLKMKTMFISDSNEAFSPQLGG